MLRRSLRKRKKITKFMESCPCYRFFAVTSPGEINYEWFNINAISVLKFSRGNPLLTACKDMQHVINYHWLFNINKEIRGGFWRSHGDKQWSFLSSPGKLKAAIDQWSCAHEEILYTQAYNKTSSYIWFNVNKDIHIQHIISILLVVR